MTPDLEMPHIPRDFNRVKRLKANDFPMFYPVVRMPKAQVHRAEARYLAEAARRLGPGDIANLGTDKGASALCLAYGLREAGHKGRVWAVDLYERQPEEKFLSTLKIHGMDQRIKICKGTTVEWASRALREGAGFRFVFIDADHEYESTKSDFERWSPMVTVKGEVAFHDIHLDSVTQVIDEIDHTKWEEVAHVWYIRTFRRTHE